MLLGVSTVITVTMYIMQPPWAWRLRQCLTGQCGVAFVLLGKFGAVVIHYSYPSVTTVNKVLTVTEVTCKYNYYSYYGPPSRPEGPRRCPGRGSAGGCISILKQVVYCSFSSFSNYVTIVTTVTTLTASTKVVTTTIVG